MTAFRESTVCWCSTAFRERVALDDFVPRYRELGLELLELCVQGAELARRFVGFLDRAPLRCPHRGGELELELTELEARSLAERIYRKALTTEASWVAVFLYGDIIS